MLKNKTILVVDDDPELRAVVKKLLELESFSVVEASNISEARAALKHPIDLAILDLQLGSENGLQLAQEFQKQPQFPIIMLTGLKDVIDRVVGLELGAIDYITKPFHAREFVARVKSGLRRIEIPPTEVAAAGVPERLQFDGWVLDISAKTLTTQESKPVPISTHQYYVLSALVQNHGRVLTREQIFDRFPAGNSDAVDRSIDIHIGNIRKILNDNPKTPKYIKTVRGIGYSFVAPVHTVV